MATSTAARPSVSSRTPAEPPPIHRLTVDEYERIVEAGALENPAKIELIDGYLIEKMAKSPGHCYATKQVLKSLDSRLPAGWTSQKEDPIRIPDFDEPDVAIIRGSDADYRHRIPVADDAALVVEVSETSLNQDRGEKRSAYARARIPVYWIVNLVDRQVEVYTRPVKAGHYRTRKDYKPGEQIPVVIDGQPLPPIPVDDILP